MLPNDVTLSFNLFDVILLMSELVYSDQKVALVLVHASRLADCEEGLKWIKILSPTSQISVHSSIAKWFLEIYRL